MAIKRKPEQEMVRRKVSMPYMTSEMSAILARVSEAMPEVRDKIDSIHFSPTALTVVRHVMMAKGAIVADTALALRDIDRETAAKLGVSLKCYIDEPAIVRIAEKRKSTRAEVALDYALDEPGLKLIAISSAPMALHRLLQCQACSPLTDVVVLAACSGFANVVQLKERIWDSDIPCIVVRGKKGGAPMAVAIINALLQEAAREQNL